MKIRLIQTVAFALLLQGAAFAQEIISVPPSETSSPCPNFPMPVIKPFVDENKLPIVKPDSNIDYKLIIIDPCVSPNEQKPSSLFSVAPQNQNSGASQLSVTPLSQSESNFTVTPKGKQRRVKMTAQSNKSMDVRAKQRLYYGRLLLNLNLRVGGFAPRHLNRSTASLKNDVFDKYTIWIYH